MAELTKGVILNIFKCSDLGKLPDEPVLQILGLKKINASNERFRAIVSDGVYMSGSALLTSQTCELVNDGSIENNCIVKFLKYTVHQLQEKKVILVLNMEVLKKSSEVEGKIGDPQALKDSDVVSESNEPAHMATLTTVTKTKNPIPTDIPQKMPKTDDLNRSINLNTSNVFPIKSLTPYQNKWTIRARVSHKTPIKTWQNSRGEGQLFSVEFCDENGEIRATGFNESVDKFYNLLQVGKVYYVSKATLKMANKAYSSVKNEYEMTFQSDTLIELCTDEDIDIPTIQYNFIKIADVLNVAKDSLIDLVAIVKSVSEPQSILTKTTNKQLIKRELTLVDSSEKSVVLTIWGEEASGDKFSSEGNVIAFKGLKVSDFAGRSLSTVLSTHHEISPDRKEAHALMGWYDNYGKNLTFMPVGGSNFMDGPSIASTQHKMLHQIKLENLGRGERPDYLVTTAVIMGIKFDNALYKACPTPNCNKKLIEEPNYRCEKCNRQFDTFVYRLMLNCNVADSSYSQWVTFFHDTAEKLLDKTADEIGQLKDSEDNLLAYEEAFSSQRLVYKTLRLRFKVDVFNDEERIRCSCVDVKPVDYVAESQNLLKRIDVLYST